MPERGIGAPAGFWFNADTLIIRAGDQVSGFYGRLADGIAITDDKMAMVFRIHPKAKWRDGVPITSKDVAYTVRLAKSQIWGSLWFDSCRLS